MLEYYRQASVPAAAPTHHCAPWLCAAAWSYSPSYSPASCARAWRSSSCSASPRARPCRTWTALAEAAAGGGRRQKQNQRVRQSEPIKEIRQSGRSPGLRRPPAAEAAEEVLVLSGRLMLAASAILSAIPSSTHTSTAPPNIWILPQNTNKQVYRMWTNTCIV